MKGIPSFWVDSAARIDVNANKIQHKVSPWHAIPPVTAPCTACGSSLQHIKVSGTTFLCCCCVVPACKFLLLAGID